MVMFDEHRTVRSPVTIYLDAQLFARLKAQAHGCGACLQGYVVGAIRDRIAHDEIVQAAKLRRSTEAALAP
jgi:hypothetical protein